MIRIMPISTAWPIADIQFANERSTLLSLFELFFSYFTFVLHNFISLKVNDSFLTPLGKHFKTRIDRLTTDGGRPCAQTPDCKGVCTVRGQDVHSAAPTGGCGCYLN